MERIPKGKSSNLRHCLRTNSGYLKIMSSELEGRR